MRFLLLIFIVALSLSACAGEQAGPIGWENPVEVASGEASVGPWRMNQSEWRYVDDATVAVSPGGDIGVAWVNQARRNIFFQRYGKDGKPLPGDPTDVSKSPDVFSWLPRVVMSDNGDVLILWQEIVFSGGTHGGEAFFSRSTDGGTTFSAPRNLSNTTNGVGKGRLTRRLWHNGSLDLAAGLGDSLYAVWTEYQGPLRLTRSTDGGQSWSEPVAIAGGKGELPTRGPSLAVSGRMLYLAWTVGDDPSADIRYTTSEDGGRTHSKPRAIAISEAHADAPKVAVHTDGTVHLAWMESPGGPFRSYRIRYTRRTPDTDAFSPPKSLSAPLPHGFDSAGFPYLELDGEGNPYILFELFRGNSRRAEGLALVRSGDAGESFSDPVAVPRGGERAAGINGSLQGLLMNKLAVTPAGGLVVVNTTFEEGEASHVWLLRSPTSALLEPDSNPPSARLAPLSIYLKGGSIVFRLCAPYGGSQRRSALWNGELESPLW